MSWSITAEGSAQEVCDKLDAYSNGLTGQCKLEFDAAAPHLHALVKQNFVKDPSFTPLKSITLNAYGSGCEKDGEQMQRSCSVTIKPNY